MLVKSIYQHPTSSIWPLPSSADVRGEGDAAGVVGRGLTQVSCERPADVRDVAVVAGGRAAAARRRSVGVGRAAVVRVGDRDGKARRAEAVEASPNLEVGVRGILVGEDEARRGGAPAVGES